MTVTFQEKHNVSLTFDPSSSEAAVGSRSAVTAVFGSSNPPFPSREAIGSILTVFDLILQGWNPQPISLMMDTATLGH